MTRKPNILLITVDTLRADHLGCYGYQRPTSAAIDRIAAQSTLCDRYFCSAIPTQPSYTTMYTGQHAINHGIVSHGGEAVLDSFAPWLPEIMLKAGYTTCALDTLMRDRLWFGRGYEYYVDPGLRRLLRLNVTCEELNSRAIPWMRAHADEPFFLFMHYWDPHAPYLPPKESQHMFYSGDNPTDPDNRSLQEWWKHPLGALARETWLRTANGAITDVDYVEAMYDREVHYLDQGVGALVGALDDLGLAENTLVIIVGDHGESMTEHGIFFEHHGLYDCTLRVPFIARWPDMIPAGRRVSGMFQMHDLAPTVLEAAGLPAPESMDGKSFWSTLTGAQDDPGYDAVISLECTLQAKWCLRTGDHKFILAREPDFYGNPLRELYDLRADPGETRNLVDERPDLAAAMEARLEDWISDRLAELGKSEDPLREQGISLKAVMEAG